MKTRKTKLVAILSQTLTTTVTTRSRSYAASAKYDYDLQNGEPPITMVNSPFSAARQHWCEECATPMAMMSPEQAATVCFQTTRAIYRLVEAGRVHFTEGPDGVMVCPASLIKDWAAQQSIPLLISPPAVQLGSS